jgi:hypothetical protein
MFDRWGISSVFKHPSNQSGSEGLYQASKIKNTSDLLLGRNTSATHHTCIPCEPSPPTIAGIKLYKISTIARRRNIPHRWRQHRKPCWFFCSASSILISRASFAATSRTSATFPPLLLASMMSNRPPSILCWLVERKTLMHQQYSCPRRCCEIF